MPDHLREESSMQIKREPCKQRGKCEIGQRRSERRARDTGDSERPWPESRAGKHERGSHDHTRAGEILQCAPRRFVIVHRSAVERHFDRLDRRIGRGHSGRSKSDLPHHSRGGGIARRCSSQQKYCSSCMQCLFARDVQAACRATHHRQPRDTRVASAPAAVASSAAGAKRDRLPAQAARRTQCGSRLCPPQQHFEHEVAAHVGQHQHHKTSNRPP